MAVVKGNDAIRIEVSWRILFAHSVAHPISQLAAGVVLLGGNRALPCWWAPEWAPPHGAVHVVQAWISHVVLGAAIGESV